MAIVQSRMLNDSFREFINMQQQLIEVSYMDYEKKTVCRVYPALHNVLYISAKNVYSYIFFTKQYSVKISMKKNLLYVAKSIGYYEDILNAYGFFRISKSCLINLTQVVMYQENGFVFMNETIQPIKVSEEMRFLLKTQLKDFCVSTIM